MKDPVPDGLCSHVVYKFVCACLNACYVGETCRHLPTLVREHLASDRASHIFKHLQNSGHCRTLCSEDSFHVLHHASTGFQLKIKKGYSCSKRKTLFESTITILNHTFSSHTFTLASFLLSPFSIISIFLLIINSTFNAMIINKLTEDDKSFCRNMFHKLKSFVVLFKYSEG